MASGNLRERRLYRSPYGLGGVPSSALVSAGLADITFTLTPKNEWDVVAGAALVMSAGGFVGTLEKTELIANRRDIRELRQYSGHLQ